MVNTNFLVALEELLEIAKENKEQQPKTDETRYWAVVYTDLEKTLAYVKTFIYS